MSMTLCLPQPKITNVINDGISFQSSDSVYDIMTQEH